MCDGTTVNAICGELPINICTVQHDRCVRSYKSTVHASSTLLQFYTQLYTPFTIYTTYTVWVALNIANTIKTPNLHHLACCSPSAFKLTYMNNNIQNIPTFDGEHNLIILRMETNTRRTLSHTHVRSRAPNTKFRSIRMGTARHIIYVAKIYREKSALNTYRSVRVPHAKMSDTKCGIVLMAGPRMCVRWGEYVADAYISTYRLSQLELIILYSYTHTSVCRHGWRSILGFTYKHTRQQAHLAFVGFIWVCFAPNSTSTTQAPFVSDMCALRSLVTFRFDFFPHEPEQLKIYLTYRVTIANDVHKKKKDEKLLELGGKCCDAFVADAARKNCSA